MTTLSTHDTKRSEDVRARLAVLSELPGRVGRRGPPMVGRAPACPEPPAGPAGLADAASAPGRSARNACTATWRRRPARPAGHQLDRAGRRVRPGRARPGPGRVLADAGPDRRRGQASCGCIRARGLVERAGPEAGPADHARRARRLPGQRAVGPTRWSTRTTAGRSTSTAPARAAGPARRGLAAADRRLRRGQAAGRRPGAAAAPGPARAVRAATARWPRTARPPARGRLRARRGPW